VVVGRTPPVGALSSSASMTPLVPASIPTRTPSPSSTASAGQALGDFDDAAWELIERKLRGVIAVRVVNVDGGGGFLHLHHLLYLRHLFQLLLFWILGSPLLVWLCGDVMQVYVMSN
jgi:hypothetical protein